MTGMTEIGYENYSATIPLLGGFLENLHQRWWDDYSSVAVYIDFYIAGFSGEELAETRKEFAALLRQVGRPTRAAREQPELVDRPGNGP